MKVLIIYATYSSGTQTASGIVEKVLTQKNHEVTSKNVVDTQPDEIQNYDLTILASPSWDYEGKEGQPHQDFVHFFAQSEDKKFPEKKFAVFGLGDSTFTHFCGAVDHLTSYAQSVGGTVIINPLKIDGFFFNQGENAQKLEAWATQLAEKMSLS